MSRSPRAGTIRTTTTRRKPPIVPRAIPYHSLKCEGEYLDKIRYLSQKESLRIEDLKFTLNGLDFHRHKEIILELFPLNQNSSFSTLLEKKYSEIEGAKSHDEVVKIIRLQPNHVRLVQSIGKQQQFNALILDAFERFEESNLSTLSNAPFSLYKYALLEELRLINSQAKMLGSRNNRKCLEHKTDSSMVNQAIAALKGKKDSYQEALELGTSYVNGVVLSQVNEFKHSSGQLRVAYKDPSSTPFSSAFADGVKLLDSKGKEAMLSVDQFNAAKSIDREHLKKHVILGLVARLR